MSTNPKTHTNQLSPMERRFMILAAEGCTETEMAETFHVSLSGVKQMAQRTYNKLGARNKAQAVAVYWMEYICPNCTGHPDSTSTTNSIL